MSQQKIITQTARKIHVQQDVRAKNNAIAEENKNHFKAYNYRVLNLMSSPGSGKTTLLTNTCHALKNKMPLAVIEGDQQTDNDAKRIAEAGAPVLQINTVQGCHLNAEQISEAVKTLNPEKGALLFIENVGNLVCPASFALGEDCRVVILSVTEGDDKPIKYPNMFAKADVMIINKMDLLPHVDFDIERCITYARQVNPTIKVIQTVAKNEDGLQDWLNWLGQI